jgi:hypothetical protein
VTVSRCDPIDAARLGLLLLAASNLSQKHSVKLLYVEPEWICITRVRRHLSRCPCRHCPSSTRFELRGPSRLAVLEKMVKSLGHLAKQPYKKTSFQEDTLDANKR